MLTCWLCFCIWRESYHIPRINDQHVLAVYWQIVHFIWRYKLNCGIYSSNIALHV